MQPRIDKGPGLNFPPPVVFVIVFIIGRVLDNTVPISWPESLQQISFLGGIALFAIGSIGSIWAMRCFRSESASLMPNKRSDGLVIAGPYRFSRNPMYVAAFAQYIGISMAFQCVWPLVLMPVIWMILNYGIIAREETYLKEEFGQPYEDYLASVRRWV